MLGFYNLWLILAVVGVFACVVMTIGDKLRGVKIENKEDHLNTKANIVSMFPLLALFGVSLFTPIVVSILFWTGCALIILAGIIYVLSIMAFVRARNGLTTLGIYKISRNPMYVAMFLVFIAFALMAWAASPAMGILTAVIALSNIGVVHWMVLEEEHFLNKEYGDSYREYMNKVPRYVGVSKGEQNETETDR